MVIHRPKFSSEDRTFFGNALKCFAKAVYEASDGKHKIGTIRIARTTNTVHNAISGYDEPVLPSGVKSPGILFSDTLGWPCANTVIGGPLGGGGPICLFGRDKAWGNGTDLFTQGLAGAHEMGVTLAHEWGHAVYGFRDEYVYKDAKTKTLDESRSVQSLMGTATRRIGSAVQWKNMNFSIEKGDGMSQFWSKESTAQYKSYGCSCWSRLIGIESVSVYKGKSNSATPSFEFENPGWESAATSELEIVWLNEPLYAFLVDTSGSMETADRLQNAKKVLINAIAKLPRNAQFAIIGFSSGVEDFGDFVPKTTTAFNRAKRQIDSLSAWGSTSIYDALDTIIDKIEARRSGEDGIAPATIILLTDGEDTSSSKTLAEIRARVAGRDIRIDTVPFGSGANTAAMNELADASGGKKLPAGDSIAELSDSFSDSMNDSVGRNTLKRNSLTVGKSGAHKTTIRTDSSLSDFVLTVTGVKVPKGGKVRLVNQRTGKALAPAASTSSGGSFVHTFLVDNPASGGWTLSLSGMPGARVSYRAEGKETCNAPRIDLYSDYLQKTVYARFSHAGVPITGATVSATVFNGNASRKVAMTSSAPGVYRLKLDSCGNISGGIVVEAVATAGKSVLRHTASTIADIPARADESVRESFARSKFYGFSQKIESTVTFDPRGGKVSPRQKTYKFYEPFGCSFPIPVRKGYAFKGWFTKVLVGNSSFERCEGFGLSMMGRENMKVYAKWTKQKADIYQFFDAEGGKLPLEYFRVTKGGWTRKIDGKYYYIASDRQTGSKLLKVGKPFGALPKPSRKGYRFTGWYAGTNSNATKISAKTIVPAYYASLHLHAHWVKTSYKVVFKANGGKGKMSAQVLTYGKAAKLKKNAFKRAGYTFAGWAKSKGGSVIYKNAARVKNLRKDGKPLTLYAKWKARPYKIAFNANGGKGKMAVQGMTYGKTAKLRKNAFKRRGYTFLGWSKTKNGKVTYKDASSVKNLRSDGKTITLFAKWRPTTYRVAFNANDGTGSIAVQHIPYGTKMRLRSNTFIRAGYKFRGWSKTATGPVVYKNAAIVENLRGDGGVVALYAVWSAVPTAKSASGKAVRRQESGDGKEVSSKAVSHPASEGATTLAANGINSMEECFVAGLDPTDPCAAFTAEISFEAGKPIVQFDPDLGDARQYTIEGKKSLFDATWVDVTDLPDPEESGYRFFRVKVAMPK